MGLGDLSTCWTRLLSEAATPKCMMHKFIKCIYTIHTVPCGGQIAIDIGLFNMVIDCSNKCWFQFHSIYWNLNAAGTLRYMNDINALTPFNQDHAFHMQFYAIDRNAFRKI